MSKILDKIVLRDTKTGISTEYTIQDTQLKERVENLIANKNDTNGNSELIDIRTGFDGNKYDTAGDAVRSQVSNLQEQVNDINNNGLIFNDDYISLKIDTWLKDHPEATTTVLDNSITKEKIEEDFLYDLRKARFYNSVANMKLDSELKAGQVCKTLGYYSINDGGGAYYVIRAKQDSDVDNGGSIHELASGLVAELIVENGTVNVEQFGAKGDGETDDTQAIQKALDSNKSKYIVFNKDYKITAGLRLSRSNVILKGICGTIYYYGYGSTGVGLTITGIDANNYINSVVIDGLKLDFVHQEYKGGASDDTPTITSPNPAHRGLIALNMRYAVNSIIKNCTINDIYGDGIKVERCYHVLINNNTLLDCSGGNPDDTGDTVTTGYDNFGDGIVIFYSNNITVSNNTLINKRVYCDTNTQYEKFFSKICGRSGLEFEYGVHTDNIYSPMYELYKNDYSAHGLTFHNNYVYGYTKGIHIESINECKCDKNTLYHNHIAIMASVSNMCSITNNYIYDDRVGTAPQVGYNEEGFGICVSGYDISNVQSSIGSIVSSNKIKSSSENDREAKYGIIIKRRCVVSNNSMFRCGINIPGGLLYNDIIVSSNIFNGSYSDIYGKTVINSNLFLNSYISMKVSGKSHVISNNDFFNTKISIDGNASDYGTNIVIDNNKFKVDNDFFSTDTILGLNIISRTKITNNFIDLSTDVCFISVVMQNFNWVIDNNVIWIRTDMTNPVCNIPNGSKNFQIQSNTLNIATTQTNALTFVLFNWSIDGLVVVRNNIANKSTYITKGGSSSSDCVKDIDANIGIVSIA